MSEENDETPQRELAVLISIAAVDAESVKDATKLRLEIEGDADIIMVFAELNVAYLQQMFGDKFNLVDGAGNPIPTLGPRLTIIDPLAGDDPVTE